MLFLFAALSHAAPNVAIADFCVLGKADSSQGALFAERFQAELLETGAFQVLDRKQMDLVLNEQGFQQSGACSAEDCTVKIGQLLGVDKIFSGCISVMDGMVSLNIKRIDVGTGVVEAQYVEDNKDGAQGALTNSTRSIARKFAGLTQETKKSNWGWWLGGGIVALGGAITAVILLTQDSDESETVYHSRDY